MHRLGLSLRKLVIVSGVVCAWACSDDDPDPAPPPDAGHDEPMGCPDDLPPFSIGEEHGLMADDAASGIRARLVDSSHGMPFKGFNDWTLAITDLDGEPLVDARLNWACAFMPSHKHGSQPRRVEIPEPGQVLLAAQNLSMEGVWEVKLWIHAASEGPEFVPQERRGLALDRGACTPKNGLDAMSTLTFEVCVPVLHD